TPSKPSRCKRLRLQHLRLALDAFSHLGHLSVRSHHLEQTKEGQTMFYQTESKPQGWRAVAVFDDRPDRLIYLGRSSTQVRAGFADPYLALFDAHDRDPVQSVRLERW